MKSSDITIIFLTANRVPKKWARFHKEKLIEAAGNSPIITISIWFSTGISIICIDHEYGIELLARTHRKRLGLLRAYDIPYWGKAENIVKKFV